MIIVAAAIMSAKVPQEPHPSQGLRTCLVYLSRLPRFASESAELIGQDSSFLKASLGYCSNEVLPYWDEAHRRAKLRLGIKASSAERLSPEDAAKMIGEQDAADVEMTSIVRGVWREVSASRDKLPMIPDEVAKKFALSWLADEKNRSSVDRVIDKPIRCIDNAAKTGAIDAGSFMTGQLNARAASRFREVAQECGYLNAAKELAKLTQDELFPGGSPRASEAAAAEFLTQMTFWSFTAGP